MQRGDAVAGGGDTACGSIHARQRPVERPGQSERLTDSGVGAIDLKTTPAGEDAANESNKAKGGYWEQDDPIEGMSCLMLVHRTQVTSLLW